MNYRQILTHSVNTFQMIDVVVPAEVLFPVVREPVDLLSCSDSSSLLFYIGGGHVDLSVPFRADIKDFVGFVLLHTLRGKGEIRQEGSCITACEQSCLVIPGNHIVTLRSQLLPWSFRIFWILSGQDSFWFSLLPKPVLLDTAPETGIRHALDDLDTSLQLSGRIGLVRGHSAVTVLLTESVCKAAEPSGKETSQTARPSRIVPSYLAAVKQYVQTGPVHDFSLRNFEDQYGVSRYRICREYSRIFGISPLQDLHRTRILQAQKMLLTTDLQVQQISSMAGYENVTYFIKRFKKETGMTPAAFRQKAQGLRS